VNLDVIQKYNNIAFLTQLMFKPHCKRYYIWLICTTTTAIIKATAIAYGADSSESTVLSVITQLAEYRSSKSNTAHQVFTI